MENKEPNNSSEPKNENALPQSDGKAVSHEKVKKQKKTLSGSYWYVQKPDEQITKATYARNYLTIIALLLQVVVLMFPQEGLKRATTEYPSLAFAYMWIVFIMFGVSIYVIIMNRVRYKIQKRIPIEYAPKYGFKKLVHMGTEVFTVINFVLFVLEIVFCCLKFDGFGLAGVFVTLLATAAAVLARLAVWFVLHDAELIKSGESVATEEKAVAENSTDEVDG